MQYTNKINFNDLQKDLFACDASNSGSVTLDQFKQVLEQNKFGPFNDQIYKMLMSELDVKNTGNMPYMDFLNSIFLTQLYIKEAKLYNEMKKFDTDNKGGITIGILNEILMSNDEF
jgi:Ca2+-binding EF-hand superfamily protein